MKLYLFDIEGTTTDINFVHKTLFPYAKEKMDEYVQNNLFAEHMREAFESVAKTALEEDGKTITPEETVTFLKKWIEDDRKHPALKEIQGHIWEHGYKSGDFTGHMYDDVLPALKKITDDGDKVGIYSSGSVKAQKLIFEFSSLGNLTPLISYYFDTNIGHKREVQSYKNIITETGFASTDISFYSDVKEELDAAKETGMNTFQLYRDINFDQEFHKQLTDFSSI